MNRFLVISCIFLALTGTRAIAQEETPAADEPATVTEPTTEAPAETTSETVEPAEEPAVQQEDEAFPETSSKAEQPSEETPAPEDYFEEETGTTETEATETSAETTGKVTEETGQGTRYNLTIDAVIVVNYTFADHETYNVKYRIELAGDLNADVGMIKGNAKVATDIGGYLAKTSLFECLLKVSIADVPYEIYFQKTGEKEAEINVAFKGQILEDWESLCTFLDASGAKFNTRGSPERWIGVALEKAKPPLTKIIMRVGSKTTTTKFSILKHTVQEAGLGSAEIDGTGVVTLKPAAKRTPRPPKPRAR